MNFKLVKGQSKGGQVDDPFEKIKLQTEEMAKNEESKNDKTEKSDIYDHYTLGKLLGCGSFGYVYAGIRKSDGKKVALKIMDKMTNDEYITIPGDTRSLPVEVALLELVSKPPHCPFVIQLLEWFETPSAIILVLERPDPCVDLYDFFTANILTEDEIRIIVRQVIFGARHCQERGVFHRDIKDNNILVNPQTLEVKLIDFGCGDLHKDTTYTDYAGTDIYMPPEVYLEEEYEAEPFTVWGLGVLLYILLCGKEPFSGESEIVYGHLMFPKKLSEASQDLILWCMQRDPERRPTLNQILRHDWFREEKLKEMPEAPTPPLNIREFCLSTADVRKPKDAPKDAEPDSICDRRLKGFMGQLFCGLTTIFRISLNSVVPIIFKGTPDGYSVTESK